MNRIVSSLLILCCICFCRSQTLPLISKDTLFVNHYGQPEGLLQLNPKSLAIDQEGFLWAGTEDGLHKFNGYNFLAYTHIPNDATTIPDDHVRDLLHINDTLWIATNTKGIIGYSIRDNAYFQTKGYTESDLSIAYKTFLINKHTLLFSLRNHCVLYDKKTQTYELIKLPNYENTTRENYITSFLKLNENQLLLGTTATGIQLLNIPTKSISNYNNTLPEIAITDFLHLNNHYFIATDKGLYHLDPSTRKLEKMCEENLEIQSLCSFNNNILLMGTALGLYTYAIKEKQCSKIILKDYQKNTYNYVDIAKILADENGNFWFGTSGNGLLQFNSQQQKFITKKIKVKEFLDHPNMNSFGFMKDNNQTLWIAAEMGIIKYSEDSNVYTLYPEAREQLIYDYNISEDGTLWAGGFGCGLLKYNEATDSFKQYTTQNGLTDNEVIEIINRPNHKLWVCTWSGGINEFDILTETFKPILLQNKQINRARFSFTDSQNNLWIGCDEGLYKLDKNNTVVHFVNNNTTKLLASNRIFAINEDSKQNIWIGTSTGLTKMNTDGQTISYYKQKGLPNDFIYGLLIDQSDRVWVSTNYGISLFDPEKETFVNFTQKDGLQNNEFNGKSAYKSKDGLFYFGGISGYNIIDPEKEIASQHPPKVYVEEIQLFNKPIQQNEIFKDTLFFKANENVLTINYAALNYLNPEKSLYQFKLNGFDKQWRTETKERSTTYTNLSPGTYTFQLRATDDLGNWSKFQDKKVFIIIPPWYQKTWFRIVFFSTILLIILLIYKLQTTRLKRANIRLENLVMQRTLDLKQNNELLEQEKKHVNFLLKELKHRVNNNFQLISSFLNIQTKSVKDEKSKEILKIAKNRINTIASIQDFLNNKKDNEINITSFIEDSCKKIVKTLGNDDDLKFSIIFKLDSSPLHTRSNPTLIGLLLNEIITNVHKHAFESSKEHQYLIIETSQEANTLKLTISDNGKGFTTGSISSDSLGLNLIEEMIEQIDATFTLETNKGTKYTIWIPLKEC